MSDLFHNKIPFPYIDKVMKVIRETPHHTYQILTKRPKIMARYFTERTCPRNAWLGVTVENRKHGVPRIDQLRHITAETRFLSVEPLLECVGDVDLTGIHWVIVGGESGWDARPMKPEWVENVRVQCEAQGAAFFFKQWGQHGADGIKRSKHANGRIYNGKTWDGYPNIPILPV